MSEQAQTQVPVVQTPAPQASGEASASGGSANASAVSTAGNSATAPPDADKPKIEVADSVSKHFAELERRKAAFEAERKAHADRLKSEEADRAAFEEWRKNRDLAKKDPVKGFAMLGMTPDDLAKALYEAPQEPDEMTKYKTRLEQVEAQLAAEQKAKADADKAAREAEHYKTATAQLSKFIEASKFEAVKSLGKDGVAEVFNRMTAAFAKTQVVPDFDKACAEVEASIDAFADQLAAIPKYQKKFAAKAAAPSAEVKSPEEKKPAPAEKKVVLSNKTNADAPAGEQRPDDPSALRERAVRALKERLTAKAAALSTKKGAEQ